MSKDGFVLYENGYAIVKTPQMIRIVEYNKHPFADGNVVYEKPKREKQGNVSTLNSIN